MNMDRFTYMCVRFLIRDAVTFTLRNDMELDFPNDLRRLYRNSVAHLNVAENFKEALDEAFHMVAIEECDTACDIILQRVWETAEASRHRVVLYCILGCSSHFGFPKINSTNFFKFMTVITKLCFSWHREGECNCLIELVIDVAAYCLCSLRLGTTLEVINIIDQVSSEYLTI